MQYISYIDKKSENFTKSEPVAFVSKHDDVTKDDNPVDFLALVDQTQQKRKCSRSEAMKIVTSENQEAHKAFLNNINRR